MAGDEHSSLWNAGLEPSIVAGMEVRRGETASQSVLTGAAHENNAALPRDFSADLSSPTVQSLVKGLLEDAVRYRELGRHGDALTFASRAATAGRSSDLGTYCLAIVEIAAAWNALGDRATSLAALEAGWSHMSTYLDRAIHDVDPPRRLLEALGTAYCERNEPVKAQLCFENAKQLFGSTTSVHADSIAALGVQALLEGDVARAGDHFKTVLYEASRRIEIPNRTMALAEVGQGIVLWLDGYDDGLQHIANGMSRARLDPAVACDCREFAMAVAECLESSADPRCSQLLKDVRHAVA